MNCKISIIVPVYNVELYIKDCIESILNQTFKEFELILINDCSTDNSGYICNRYAENDCRVKVIHNKFNKGVSESRNIGINISRGRYIGFIDSDDTIHPEMYKKMYDFVTESNAEIVACGYNEINYIKNSKLINATPLSGEIIIEGINIKNEFERLIVKNKVLTYASLCNKLYKKQYLEEKKIVINKNLKVAEDLCFNIEAILNSNKIVAINEPLYNYRRINNESIMNNKNKDFHLDVNASNEILRTLKRNRINNDVYLNCMQYENSCIILRYMDEIKKKLLNKNNIFKKFGNINSLINEEAYINSIKYFDKNIITLKVKIAIKIINIILIKKRLILKYREFL